MFVISNFLLVRFGYLYEIERGLLILKIFYIDEKFIDNLGGVYFRDREIGVRRREIICLGF